jgi:hypothetical protein
MGSGLYRMASQVQHSSGIGKEVAACFGEFSTMRDSPEETRLEALFKVSDMAAQRWLCGVESFCRLTEIALLGYGDKGDEMTELGALVHDCTNLIWLCSAGRGIRGQLMLECKLLQNQRGLPICIPPTFSRQPIRRRGKGG